ncbi:MAG: PD40 domain-containing protein [Ignavibacteriales bacterium]|nr:PD40 domain-containing protein [Ignavibacteriales bacterium]
MQKKFFLFFVLFLSEAFCQSISFPEAPQLFMPDMVCTANSEIKITFSKDGNTMLWGTIGWENGKGGWDIWQSTKTKDGWSKPSPVSFNSDSNDFDPCFSADGRIVYFFSNRVGGFGGDDLYQAAYDNSTGTFSQPTNLGNQFNTKGDEWGPTESPDGKKFMYCTDGFNRIGKHDVFICLKNAEDWGAPENLKPLNSLEDDFDPVFLHDGKTIIFTRKINGEEAFLFISYLGKEGYTEPVQLSSQVNVPLCWTLGASLNPSEKSYIYYATRIPGNTKGRLDIYRIYYSLSEK